MRQLRLMFSWLVLFAFVLGGCAPTAPVLTRSSLPPIRADTIGRLLVDGRHAFINGQPVVQNGSYVFSGDHVSTGDATSVLVVLNDGGEVQLDQNTDPTFLEAYCLVVEMAIGRAAVKNAKCLELRTKKPNTASLLNSFVHIENTPDVARVTVLEGSVTVQSPSQASLRANEEYVARSDGGVEILQLTPEQAYARVEWTRDYFRQPATQQSDGLSPGEAAVIGGLIATIVKYIFGRNKDAAVQPESRTTPQNSGQSPPPAGGDIRRDTVPVD
jgi:hypothetical protein